MEESVGRPSLYKSIKRFLVGDPISSALAHHERLDKKTALAVFSSDALSSVAYSTEAILLVLLAAGSAAMGYLVPIIIGIIILPPTSPDCPACWRRIAFCRAS